MIKLGVNTVLFGGDGLEALEVAMKHIAWAGFDGVELSALQGMADHLILDEWATQADAIKKLSEDYDLELLSMEAGTLDEDRLTKAFEAGQAIGIPVINVCPGGTADVEEDFQRQTDVFAARAEMAESYGVTLCVKAHVGASIYNTTTTLRAMEKIKSPAFGIDMDPSHVYRSGEDPAKALPAVLSGVKHIHIRDCKGRGPGPGEPCDQACGRGDIDLMGYCKAMVDGGYDGPVCLECIGAGSHELSQQAIIAAETYGYLNACLRALGGR